LSENLVLKIKKINPKIVTPTRAHDTDACYDIYCPFKTTMKPRALTKINLGFHVETPPGYKLCIYSRSGLASKGILLTNSVGIIDPDYRGEVMAVFFNENVVPYEVNVGDRILQMALEKIWPFELEEVTKLSDTVRGAGGFGSTGR